MADNSGLTDEQVRCLRDPSLLETDDDAAVLLEWLDYDIASIMAQLNTEVARRNGSEWPEERLIWFRRASYAAARKRGQVARVLRRRRELRQPREDPAPLALAFMALARERLDPGTYADLLDAARDGMPPAPP